MTPVKETMVSLSIIMFVIAAISTGTGGVLLLNSSNRRDRNQRRAARNGERKGYELLDRFGCQDRLENIVIGREGRRGFIRGTDFSKVAEVDAIVHGENCIMTVEIKSWSGEIHGSENDREWKVVNDRNGTSYRRNPLLQAGRHARIVRDMYPGVRVIPVVIILGWSQFAGDIPEGVITWKSAWKLANMIQSREDGDDSDRVNAVWNRIVEDEYAPGADERKEKYLHYIRRKHGGPKPWVRALFAAGCFGFLAGSVIWNAWRSGIFQ